MDPCHVYESMKNDLPNKITANELKKVPESLKVAREEKKKTRKKSQRILQFVELQRLSENSNQSSQT